MSMLVALSIFIITLILVIWKPFGLSIGWSAIGGAILALALHAVTMSDVLSVTKIVWDATFTFVGIIVVSTVLDEMGFFEWAALTMAVAAKGNGKRVFVYVVLLGALVAAFFSNDGAALILTPIVLEKMKLLRWDAKTMIPFLMASGFIADTTSTPLVISNLVNIVSADFFHIPFIQYAVRMVVPSVVSLGASLLFLYLYYRRHIPSTFDPSHLPQPRSVIRHRGLFATAWVVLAVLMIGYVLTELFHIPVSFVEATGAIALLIAGSRTKVIQPTRVIREAPWAIVVFSIGMYVVVYGLRNAGLTHFLATFIHLGAQHGLLVGTFTMGFTAALLSSLMNNMPTVMIDALAVHTIHAGPALQQALQLANVVGCDLGPKITPIGSLATLLWLHTLNKKGLVISSMQYIRTGLVLTIPTLAVTLLGLSIWLRVI